MFGLDWLFGWVFGLVFYFILGRVEDVVTWLLPIYMTVQTLRKNETTKFNNYLSFWCLASLLFGIDWISGFLLHNILIFRLVRVCFLIWIFIDNAHNSVFLVNTFLTPVIDEHRESIEKAFDIINDSVENVNKQITDQAKEKIGSIVQSSQQEIMTGVLNFASTATKSVTSMVSNAEPANDNSSDNTNSESTTTSSSSSSSTSATTNATDNKSNNDAAVTTTSDDSKDVEK